MLLIEDSHSVTNIHVFVVFWTTRGKEVTETLLQEPLVEIPT